MKALDIALVVFMGLQQVTLVVAFILAVFSSLRQAMVKAVTTYLRHRETRTAVQNKKATVLANWQMKLRAVPASAHVKAKREGVPCLVRPKGAHRCAAVQRHPYPPHPPACSTKASEARQLNWAHNAALHTPAQHKTIPSTNQCC